MQLTQTALIDDFGRLFLPDKIREELSIAIGDELQFFIDDETDELVINKPFKFTKDFLTSQRILMLAKKYTQMECLIKKDGNILHTSVANAKMAQTKEKANTLFTKKNKTEPTFILIETERFEILKTFSLKNYEKDLGELVIFSKKHGENLSEQTSMLIQNLIDFAIGRI